MNVKIQSVSKSWGSECSLILDKGTATAMTVFGPNTLSDHTTRMFGPFCLKPGQHTAELTDSYGDGWHGGFIRVIHEASGQTLADNLGIDFNGGRTKTYSFEVKNMAPSPPPPPVSYCDVPGEYYENGRTNFGNDVCNGCTLADCRSRCTGIDKCIGFDTSISGESSHGTCWLKSHISMDPSDVRHTSGTRTTYFSSRLPADKRKCGIHYCNVAGEYYENGRTNFGNDVCNGCTLAQCRARCNSISGCVGFDTSVSGETSTGTCWMKSYISMSASDVRKTSGTRTTYFNTRLPANKRRCNPAGESEELA